MFRANKKNQKSGKKRLRGKKMAKMDNFSDNMDFFQTKFRFPTENFLIMIFEINFSSSKRSNNTKLLKKMAK